MMMMMVCFDFLQIARVGGFPGYKHRETDWVWEGKEACMHTLTELTGCAQNKNVDI